MTGNFNIQSGVEGAITVQGISHRHCRVVQRADGYGYVWQKTQLQQPKGAIVSNKPTRATSKAATTVRSAPVLTGLKADVSQSKIR
jgi:hypothetical protein